MSAPNLQPGDSIDLAPVDIEAIDASSVRPSAPPRRFPPVREVMALWNACAPCAADPEVAAWLRSHGLDPAAVDRFGLARALPVGVPLPRWASYRGAAERARTWAELGYRALFPLVDRDGEIRSVRARLVVAKKLEVATPKSLPPSGHASAGLLLANPLGRLVLNVAAWRASADPAAVEHGGDGWPSCSARTVGISEGEIDWLAWATREDITTTHALFGITGAGAWTPAFGERFPAGARVVVRTDPDDAGDAYALDIGVALRGRCNVMETDPEGRAARRRERASREALRARGVA